MSASVLLIGAHMSIADGFDRAVENASSIGCTTFQMFTKSNRQFAAKPITNEQANRFKAAIKQHEMKDVVAHAAYIINIASPDSSTRNRSIKSVVEELERCTQLGIKYLVLHPGSAVTATQQEAVNFVIESLDSILDEYKGQTIIVLETMAGQGSTVGSTFEQIGQILKNVKQKHRLAVCLDTCHVYAAGHDFSTPDGYKKMWKEFDMVIGRKHLKVIHINDSKKELGSRVDRHEEIGKGKIGKEGFALIFNDKTLFDIPKIMETPKASLEDDARNMATIKGLLSSETRRLLGVK